MLFTLMLLIIVLKYQFRHLYFIKTGKDPNNGSSLRIRKNSVVTDMLTLPSCAFGNSGFPVCLLT